MLGCWGSEDEEYSVLARGDCMGISSWGRHLHIALRVAVLLALQSSDLPLVPVSVIRMAWEEATIRSSSRGVSSLWHKPCTAENRCLEMTGWQQVTETEYFLALR